VLPTPVATDEIVLDETGCPHCGLRFTINGEAWPDVPSLHAKLGETRRWLVSNDSWMDHPFHLHGFRFQPVSSDGWPIAVRAWKDTINVPAGATLELDVAFDGGAGSWLYHCHILEHADRGMMAIVEVEE
jgi:FtsP/CotA-like multicopper oxidase with cupredoxin domain